jgi:hypothetical protein
MTEATLLLHQIHPSLIKLGRFTSQAFRPTPKDEHRLSVYDGDLIEPSASWEHDRKRDLESVGVIAVTVEDCKYEHMGVRSSPEHFREHAEIDFQGLSANQSEKKGKRLKSVAKARGWLHEPDVG